MNTVEVREMQFVSANPATNEDWRGAFKTMHVCDGAGGWSRLALINGRALAEKTLVDSQTLY